MMRLVALLLLTAALTACASGVRVPVQHPECHKPDREPIDGGIGGTGNQKTGNCPRKSDG